MQQLLTALPFLACPIAMGAMMWWMSRQGHDQEAQTPAAKDDQAAEVARLRAEVDELRAAHQASVPVERRQAGQS